MGLQWNEEREPPSPVENKNEVVELKKPKGGPYCTESSLGQRVEEFIGILRIRHGALLQTVNTVFMDCCSAKRSGGHGIHDSLILQYKQPWKTPCWAAIIKEVFSKDYNPSALEETKLFPKQIMFFFFLRARVNQGHAGLMRLWRCIEVSPSSLDKQSH